MCECVNVCMCACVDVWMCGCVDVFTRILCVPRLAPCSALPLPRLWAWSIAAPGCAYVCTRIHAYTHTRIHAYTHIRIHVSVCVFYRPPECARPHSRAYPAVVGSACAHSLVRARAFARIPRTVLTVSMLAAVPPVCASMRAFSRALICVCIYVCMCMCMCMCMCVCMCVCVREPVLDLAHALGVLLVLLLQLLQLQLLLPRLCAFFCCLALASRKTQARCCPLLGGVMGGSLTLALILNLWWWVCVRARVRVRARAGTIQ